MFSLYEIKKKGTNKGSRKLLVSDLHVGCEVLDGVHVDEIVVCRRRIAAVCVVGVEGSGQLKNGLVAVVRDVCGWNCG